MGGAAIGRSRHRLPTVETVGALSVPEALGIYLGFPAAQAVGFLMPRPGALECLGAPTRSTCVASGLHGGCQSHSRPPWTRQPPWDPDATHVESVGAPDALQRPRARHKKAHRFSGGKAEINAECLGHGTARPPFQRWAAGCRDRPIAAPDPLPLPWDSS